MRALLFCAVVVVLTACPEPQVRVDGGAAVELDSGAPPPDAGTDVDAGTDGDAGTPVDAGTQLDAGTVTWSPCPLRSDGANSTLAECTTLRVPLRATEPSGPTLEYFIKRYRPPNGRALRALWMLQGGPGASGQIFDGIAELFATRFPDVEFYIPDHRGTGRSSRLSCPEQESRASAQGLYITADEWPACLAAVQAEVGPALAAYSMTNAAHDVGFAIDATRKEGQPVFVYGVSYGSSLAHRYLQLFPNQADGVVLDSIAPPGMSLYRQDEDSHEAARSYFEACAADTVCGAKLGPDVWAKAESLFARLKTGHCAAIARPEIPTHVLLRRVFGSLLMNPEFRGYVAPVVYRADRCDARDVTALRQFLAQVSGEPASVPLEHQLWGWVLSNNVLHSEFGETPRPTPMELAAIRERCVASRDITEALEATLNWPVYALDAYAGQYAQTSTPMLMLSGGLDPATILRKARALRPHFTGPNQTWVELPTATHTTLFSSPYVNAIGERRSCGTAMLMGFIENPRSPVDTSCVARVEGIDWALPRTDVNLALFGSANAWE